MVTDIGLAVIILFVYFTAFMPVYPVPFSKGPVMKGNTNGDNVALQIAVNEGSDIDRVYGYNGEPGR